MLKPANRLAKTRDFNLLLKHGFYIKGRFLDLKWLKLANIVNYYPKKVDVDKFKKQLRLAFSVGLKVSKSAVKRNRVKRQTREAVRLLIKKGAPKEGYYLLYVAKPAILDQNYASISQEVELLLKKAGVV